MFLRRYITRIGNKIQTLLSAQDRSLIQRLHAFRYLPPGTSLPQIPGEMDQRLFNDLIRLSDEEDIYSWLQIHTKRQFSIIALRMGLEEIKTMSHAIQTSGVGPNEHDRQLLGGLLDMSTTEFPFDQLETLEESDNPEELLRHLYRHVQSLYQRSTHLDHLFQGYDEHEKYLVNLLRLSQDRDPLYWLEETHAQFAMRFVLSRLLNRSQFLHEALAPLPTLRILKVNRRFRPFPGVLVDIKNLIVKTEGFLVQVELKLSRRKLLSEGSSPHTVMLWNGFEKV